MSDMHEKKIDDTLRAMTEWEGDAPSVWKRAAAEVESRPPTTRRSLRDLLYRRVPRPVLTAAALLLIVVLVVAALQTQHRPRAAFHTLQRSEVSISETNLKQFGTAQSTVDGAWDDSRFAPGSPQKPDIGREIHGDWFTSSGATGGEGGSGGGGATRGA